MIVDESGGEDGRCGGGVIAVGQPTSEDAGECIGDVCRGEKCPRAWSDVAGEVADAGLFSTSRRRDDRKVGPSPRRLAAAADDSG